MRHQVSASTPMKNLRPSVVTEPAVSSISSGTERDRVKYNKNARRHSLYNLKVYKTYDYIPELQSKIVAGRISSNVGMSARRTLRPNDPRRLGLVPPVPKPTKEELRETQVSRGFGSTD